MEPGARINALNQFAKRIHNAPEIKVNNFYITVGEIK